MKKFILFIASTLFSLVLFSQWNYYSQYGLIPEKLLDEIIGEASGEQAFNHILEMAAYNRPRPLDEYATTLKESDYVISVLKSYGVDNAKIERFGKTSTWKGIQVNYGKSVLIYERLLIMMICPYFLLQVVTMQMLQPNWFGLVMGQNRNLKNMILQEKSVLLQEV